MKSKFTYEEKRAILALYISNFESCTSIIWDVSISQSTFYTWRSAYRKEHEEVNVRC